MAMDSERMISDREQDGDPVSQISERFAQQFIAVPLRLRDLHFPSNEMAEYRARRPKHLWLELTMKKTVGE